MNPPALSQYDLQILALLAQGLRNVDIARLTGKTEYAIKNRLKIIYERLGLWNRVELALWYEARKYEGAFPESLSSLMESDGL